MNAIYRWWTALVFAGVVVQIGLAGYGAFYAVDKAENDKTIGKHAVEHGFAAHGVVGYLVILLGILLLPIAVAAKVDRSRRRLGIAVAVLMVLQFGLALLGWATAPLGVLHPINAVAIAAVTGMLAAREWRPGRSAAAVPAAAIE